MKNMIRSSVLSFLLMAVSMAFGVTPPVNVTVSDTGGKAAFKGTTDRSGSFTTGTLKPGNYVVQFRSTDAGLQGKHYALVVAAGTKKVSATAVAGERFAGGGVAMKLGVANVSPITGQVSAENGSGPPIGTNGKPMVWIGQRTGSNIAAHWANSDSAEAKEVQTSGSMSTKNIQDRQNAGDRPGL